jgi:hypothetical protein
MMRRKDRPELNSDNPEKTVKLLIRERDPIYAEADVTIDSRDVPHEKIVEEILHGLYAVTHTKQQKPQRIARIAESCADDSPGIPDGSVETTDSAGSFTRRYGSYPGKNPESLFASRPPPWSFAAVAQW